MGMMGKKLGKTWTNKVTLGKIGDSIHRTVGRNGGVHQRRCVASSTPWRYLGVPSARIWNVFDGDSRATFEHSDASLRRAPPRGGGLASVIQLQLRASKERPAAATAAAAAAAGGVLIGRRAERPARPANGRSSRVDGHIDLSTSRRRDARCGPLQWLVTGRNSRTVASAQSKSIASTFCRFFLVFQFRDAATSWGQSRPTSDRPLVFLFGVEEHLSAWRASDAAPATGDVIVD